MSTHVKMTIKRFASIAGLTNAEAAGFIGALVAFGDAKKLDETIMNTKETSPGSGKFVKVAGKSPILYSIPREISIKLPDDVTDEVAPKVVTAKKIVTYEYVDVEDEVIDETEDVEVDAEVAATV